MELIPLFPLEIVVFPGEKLNLHIFEPRYRQLINDCKLSQEPLGIPYFQKGLPLKHGTTVELLEIAREYPDGKMDIRTLGLRPFELKRYRKAFPDKLYPGGYVEFYYFELEGKANLRKEISNQVKNLFTVMSIKELPEEFQGEYSTFDIGHKIGLSKEQEYRLLQIPIEEDRQMYILNHLKNLVPSVQKMEQMRKKIQMNGYFKNISSPS